MSKQNANLLESKEARNVLQLKVCSARKLAAPCNAFALIDFGTWTRQTSVKRYTDKPIWNETFIFPVESTLDFTIILKSKDTLGKIIDLGSSTVAIPAKINELCDIWIILDNQADVHLCMQLEPLGDRSLDTILSPGSRQSARSSLMRFGGSLKLFSTTNNHNNSSSSSTLPASVESISDFTSKAGAVTLTEICQSLDRLRDLIYLAGSQPIQQGVDNEDDRVKQLQRAKVELDELEDQVEAVEGLSEEWREKLSNLIGDYAKDCWKLLSDESWERLALKRQSARLPPPVPLKRANSSSEAPTSSPRFQITSSLNEAAMSPEVSSPVRAGSKTVGVSSSSGNVGGKALGSTSNNTRNRTGSHLVIVKDHFLSSLEAFDEMMDIGFTVDLLAGSVDSVGSPSQTSPSVRDILPHTSKLAIIDRLGEIARFKMVSFVYDCVSCKAVSYDGPREVEMILVGLDKLEDCHEDVPKGLMAALATGRIPHGTKRCIVTVTPDWGFGDDGHVKGVPPNSTVMFELRDVSFSSPSSPRSSLGDSTDISMIMGPSKSSSTLAKIYTTFPRREPQVILHVENPPVSTLKTSSTPPPAPPLAPPPAPPPLLTKPSRAPLLKTLSSSSPSNTLSKPAYGGEKSPDSISTSRQTGQKAVHHDISRTAPPKSPPKSPPATVSSPSLTSSPNHQQGHAIMAELSNRLSRRGTQE